MTRCLVTGATGLIGRHAVRALVDAGFDVHVVARRIPEDPSTDVTWYVGDLLAQGEAARIAKAARATHLLHLAWVTEHGAFWHAPENDAWCDASRSLIEAFNANGGTRVVMAGSCAEYNWTALGDGVCHEDKTPITPHTAYGKVKAETHHWLSTFAKHHDMSYAWGRVFFLYGAGEDEKRLVPSVATALMDGREAKCSSGTQIRDFMDARDVGRAFSEILQSDVSGALNVASGEGHSIAEVVTLLADIAGRPELVHLGALDDRPDDPPVLLADVTKLHRDVGFTPYISLRDGLVDVYHENGLTIAP